MKYAHTAKYELEHPEDEIEYDDFAQVHDKDYPF